MSEPLPNQGPTNTQTIVFMVLLSFFCAFILSILASVLEKPKEVAKDLDRSKQMMIAAKLLDHNGRFLENEIPVQDKATNAQILEVYKKRIKPLLVDLQGNKTTFQEAKINEDDYLAKYKKTGYYKEPLKLIYEILTENDSKPIGYVIPVNGYGLWDAIYGYLAIKPDGNTIVGISWYDQKETPGLGANISEQPWQDLFPGKVLFQESPGGTTDFQSAPLGIVVVKGKVVDVYGNSAKSKSAVDGMAGATLTGNGVTDAYREVLAAYRPFLIKVHNEKGS